MWLSMMSRIASGVAAIMFSASLCSCGLRQAQAPNAGVAPMVHPAPSATTVVSRPLDSMKITARWGRSACYGELAPADAGCAVTEATQHYDAEDRLVRMDGEDKVACGESTNLCFALVTCVCH